MKIVFQTSPLTDIETRGYLLDDEKQIVSLMTASVRALLIPFPDEPDVKGKEKQERGKLAMRIREAGGEPVEITIDELALVKELIGKAYGPKVVTPCYQQLEDAIT